MKKLIYWKPMQLIKMKTIINKVDFDEIILNHDNVIFFVHSPWSFSSVTGLQVFKEIINKNPDLTFVIIDNETAESFIYECLKEYATKSDLITVKQKNWINGNGEIFEIRKGSLVWFEQNVSGQNVKKMM